MAEYPNRSDLRNAATRKVAFKGQTYGEGAAQARSQQAVSPGSAPSEVAAQQVAVQRPRPGAQPLTRPSERPGEPVTAGAPFGDGSMQSPTPQRLVAYDDVLDTLQMLYQMYPNDGVARLISKYVENNF